MTPTPAETALWRALNREPEKYPAPPYRAGGAEVMSAWRAMNGPHRAWLAKHSEFKRSHPADRLAYFEGKVRERGLIFHLDDRGVAFVMNWHGRALDGVSVGASAPTEHLARFHASARALAALGVITDDVKEIEGHD